MKLNFRKLFRADCSEANERTRDVVRADRSSVRKAASGRDFLRQPIGRLRNVWRASRSDSAGHLGLSVFATRSITFSSLLDGRIPKHPLARSLPLARFGRSERRSGVASVPGWPIRAGHLHRDSGSARDFPRVGTRSYQRGLPGAPGTVSRA